MRPTLPHRLVVFVVDAFGNYRRGDCRSGGAPLPGPYSLVYERHLTVEAGQERTVRTRYTHVSVSYSDVHLRLDAEWRELVYVTRLTTGPMKLWREASWGPLQCGEGHGSVPWATTTSTLLDGRMR